MDSIRLSAEENGFWWRHDLFKISVETTWDYPILSFSPAIDEVIRHFISMEQLINRQPSQIPNPKVFHEVPLFEFYVCDYRWPPIDEYSAKIHCLIVTLHCKSWIINCCVFIFLSKVHLQVKKVQKNKFMNNKVFSEFSNIFFQSHKWYIILGVTACLYIIWFVSSLPHRCHSYWRIMIKLAWALSDRSGYIYRGSLISSRDCHIYSWPMYCSRQRSARRKIIYDPLHLKINCIKRSADTRYKYHLSLIPDTDIVHHMDTRHNILHRSY